MTAPPATEDLLRTLAPQVLGALVRRYGHFDAAEDAVQEALLAAVQQWPAEGRPDNPAAWLSTVATRRMIDQLRGDDARRRREDDIAPRLRPDPDVIVPAGDDMLTPPETYAGRGDNGVLPGMTGDQGTPPAL